MKRVSYTRRLTQEGGLLVRLDPNQMTMLPVGTLIIVEHDSWKPGLGADELLVRIEVVGRGTASGFFLPSEIIRFFDPDRSTW